MAKTASGKSTYKSFTVNCPRNTADIIIYFATLSKLKTAVSTPADLNAEHFALPLDNPQNERP